MSAIWTCPRCGRKTTLAGPGDIRGISCPACNYPDAPDGYTGPQPDLEEDEGEEQRRMAEAAGQQRAPIGAALLPGVEQLEEDGYTVLGPGETAPIHAGWIEAVLRQLLDEESAQTRRRTLTVPDNQLTSFSQLLAERLAQPRWALLCGCRAGDHADTLAAMQEAHPERRSR